MTCRTPSGTTFVRLIDNALVSDLTTVPHPIPWLFGADDKVVYNPMSPPALQLFLDGGSAPLVGPSTSAFLFLTGDGNLAAVDSAAHWLDGSTWRRFGAQAEFFDRRGSAGVQVETSLGRVSFLGSFVADVIPTSDPNVLSRYTTGFLETDQLRVFLGTVSFGLTPRGLFDPQPAGLAFLRAGLPDGGSVSVRGSGSSVLSWGFANNANVSVLLPLPTTRALTLLGTAQALTLMSAPDGGQVFVVNLDGGVNRVNVPVVNPDLLKPAGPSSVLVGRLSQGALFELSMDGGVRPLVAPTQSLLDACVTNGLWFATDSSTLFVSHDGVSWTSTTGGPNLLACGAGIAAGIGDNRTSGSTMFISDGGAVLRVQMPDPIARGGVTHVDSTGRVWFVSSGAEVGYVP